MGKNGFETSKSERLSYGGFFLGQNIIYIIQLQFLAYFYVEFVGITLAHTTLMLLIAKLWDAFNDPIMGAIVDRVNFKKGKYLPWLKVVTYLLPISMFTVFINLEADYTLKLIFAYVTYILWDMIYTISDAPLFSLSTIMTSSTYERDTLMAYGRFAAAIAAISSAVFMSLKYYVGWTWTAAIYCIIAFILMFPLQFLGKERVVYNRSSDLSFKKIFIFLFKNKYLLIYYVGYFAITATNSLQTMAVYFANSNLGNESLVTIIMGIGILPIIIVAPFLPMLIKKLGKKKLTVYCSIFTIGLCIIQYAVGYDSFIAFIILAAIRVLFMQIPLMIYGMFTADCIEYGAYINGERTEGIAFSIQTFVTKLGGAVCTTLCLGLLSFFGYIEQAAIQSQRTLDGIWIILSLIPIGGYLIMLLIMAVYRLDENAVEKMIIINREKLLSEDRRSI